MSLSPATKAVGDSLIKTIKDAIARAVDPHKAALAALEARIHLLEQRKGFEYRGVWAEGETYQPNNFCTYEGSVWHTDSTTLARPGVPGSSWKLAVKRGKNR